MKQGVSVLRAGRKRIVFPGVVALSHGPIMSPPDQPPAADTTRDQHEVIRRDMLRTNTAVGIVLLIVLALALAAVLSGSRATRNLQRAEQAEADSEDRKRVV